MNTMVFAEMFEGIMFLLFGIGFLIAGFLTTRKRLPYGAYNRYYGTVTEVNHATNMITVTYGDGAYTVPYNMELRAKFDGMPEVGFGVLVLAYRDHPEQIYSVQFMKEARADRHGNRSYLSNTQKGNLRLCIIAGLLSSLVGIADILSALGII